jgi:hypothetical protein
MNKNSKPDIKVSLELCVWEVTEADCNLVEDKMVVVSFDGNDAISSCRLRFINGKYEIGFTVNGEHVNPLE